MRQQHITHAAGTFATCGGCRREPKHIASYGSTSREPIVGTTANLERHHLECNPCGRRTAMHAALGAAEAEWFTAFASRPAAPPVVDRTWPLRNTATRSGR